MKKNIKKLALAFALVATLPTVALAQPTYNVPMKATAVISLFGGSSKFGTAFDANKISYDVDINTGLCFAATMFRGGNNRMMGMTNVPCNDKVLKLISPEKRKTYINKFGTTK